MNSVAYDIERTMALQRLGDHDPTTQMSEHTFATIYVDSFGSVACVRLRRAAEEQTLAVECEGERAANNYSFWQMQFPLSDGLELFEPKHRLLRFLHATFPALRIHICLCDRDANGKHFVAKLRVAVTKSHKKAN